MAKKIKNNARDLAMIRLSPVNGAKAYAEMRQEVVKAGILKRSYGFYTILLLIVFGGLFYSAYNIYIQTSILSVFFWCVATAFFAMQIAGILHDAGHRAIFASTKANDAIGYLAGFCIASVYSHWVVRHNKHHAHPNQDDEDPDIEIPFSFTEDRYKTIKGYKRLIRLYQVYLYYPLGALVFLSFRLTGLKFLLKKRTFASYVELAGFLLSIMVWIVVPFLVFDLAKALVVFFGVNFSMGLYMMNIFAPNHKGMVEIDKGVKVSFFEQQVITSRNIRGGWLTDKIYMGLNYQIEHHLFPNCPRNKLKYITPFLLKACKQHKLPVENVGAFESTKIILSQMHAVSMSDRRRMNRLSS